MIKSSSYNLKQQVTAEPENTQIKNSLSHSYIRVGNGIKAGSLCGHVSFKTFLRRYILLNVRFSPLQIKYLTYLISFCPNYLLNMH